jgi:hypothetical protein
MPMFMTSNDDDHDIKHLDEDAPQLWIFHDSHYRIPTWFQV